MTGIGVQLQLPLGSFIILTLCKIRDAPVMEKATRCLGCSFYYTSALQDSWAKGNGERHTAVPAGDAAAMILYNTSDVGRKSSVMENDQHQEPPCGPPEPGVPKKQYTC